VANGRDRFQMIVSASFAGKCKNIFVNYCTLPLLDQNFVLLQFKAMIQVGCADEEDIVDVVSIGDEFQELYGFSTMAELIQHINTMHNYHSQRFPFHRCSSTEHPSTRQSSSKFSINLPMPARSTPSRWSDSITVLSDGRRRRVTVERRTKREALNDLERRRRYALARELSALRAVVPEMNEGFRAAKVVILAAAQNYIHLLEHKLRRDQNILKNEREHNAKLKARLQALSVDESTVNKCLP